jgi:general secretion pathway protein I
MKRRGFTLLEVLVSLVIFAVATVALAAAYINVLNAYDVVGRGNVRDEDVRFARAQLLAEADREKAEEGADFAAASDNGRVVWRSEIEPTTTADLFRVTFTCEVTENNAATPSRPVVQTLFLLRPTWSEGVDQAKFRGEARERILELRKKLP